MEREQTAAPFWQKHIPGSSTPDPQTLREAYERCTKKSTLDYHEEAVGREEERGEEKSMRNTLALGFVLLLWTALVLWNAPASIFDYNNGEENTLRDAVSTLAIFVIGGRVIVGVVNRSLRSRV
jgi:cation transport ATPase